MSGTSFLDFNDTPVRFIVGKRGDGFKQQMAAFNFERWYVSVCMLRLSRVCLEECIKWSIKRKTFGKPIYEHQAVQMRLAEMICEVESAQAWLDMLTYQLNALDPKRAAVALGDVMCGLKAQCSIVYEKCANNATHILGGYSLQIDGPGHLVEPSLTQTKAYTIPAGSRDVMMTFLARSTIKLAQNIAKL